MESSEEWDEDQSHDCVWLGFYFSLIQWPSQDSVIELWWWGGLCVFCMYSDICFCCLRGFFPYIAWVCKGSLLHSMKYICQSASMPPVKAHLLAFHLSFVDCLYFHFTFESFISSFHQLISCFHSLFLCAPVCSSISPCTSMQMADIGFTLQFWAAVSLTLAQVTM